MFRQRNDTGGVLESHEFGLSIGPGEEFECSLPVPGCTPVLSPVPGGDSGVDKTSADSGTPQVSGDLSLDTGPAIGDAVRLETTGTGAATTEDPSGEEPHA